MRRLLPAGLIAVAGLAAAPAALAQDPPTACTLIGCDSGVRLDAVDLPRARTVTLCVEDRCRRERANTDLHFVATRSDGPGPVRVRVVVRDRRGRVLVRAERAVTLRRFEPNGPECAPTCWSARVRLDGGRLRQR